METTNVQALIKDIKENLKQKSASKRDEVAVMKAMLNDTSFQVTDYATGESHCPATEYREMLSNVVSATTKITKAEASTLVAGYEAKKSDAETMVALSKDFINGALRTGRKVNLGATEKSNISIQLKEIPESEKKFPMKTGVNDDGTPRYEKAQTIIPAHEGLKVSSPCPTWTTADGKKKK
ncbi:MAG: hypothetical protein VZR64_00205 [Eubacterium sp.]|nr:hypothetical protein [Eubacterium sp.]